MCRTWSETQTVSFVTRRLIFLLDESNGWCNCNVHIANGEVDQSECRVYGVLSYSCADGYERATEYPHCISPGQVSQQWDRTPSCQQKKCDYPIPNGAVSSSCKIGSICEYTCLFGYLRLQTSIKCNVSSNLWDGVNAHSLCFNKYQCPYDVPNGGLGINCRRRYGDTCGFWCSDGYQSSFKVNKVYCNSSQKWDPPLHSACTDILCSETVPNGRVHRSCSRRLFSNCSDLECDVGYYQFNKRLSDSMWCNAYGRWTWLEKSRPECTKIPPKYVCPQLQFENAKLSMPCNRTLGSECNFTCNSGCYHNPHSPRYLNNDNDGRIYCYSSSSYDRPMWVGILSNSVSCECLSTLYTLFGCIGGAIILVILGCIVIERIRRKRALLRNNNPVAYPSSISTVTRPSPNIAVIGSGNSVQQNNVPSTERNPATQTTVNDNTTTTLRNEHRAVEFQQDSTQNTGYCQQADQLCIPVAQRYSSTGIQVHRCMTNSVTEEPYHINNTPAERLPSYTAATDSPPNYNEIAEMPYIDTMALSYTAATLLNPNYYSTLETPNANSLVADRPPSYDAAVAEQNSGGISNCFTETSDIPPSYDETVGVPHNINTTADIPPDYNTTLNFRTN